MSLFDYTPTGILINAFKKPANPNVPLLRQYSHPVQAQPFNVEPTEKIYLLMDEGVLKALPYEEATLETQPIPLYRDILSYQINDGNPPAHAEVEVGANSKIFLLWTKGSPYKQDFPPIAVSRLVGGEDRMFAKEYTLQHPETLASQKFFRAIAERADGQLSKIFDKIEAAENKIVRTVRKLTGNAEPS